MKTRQLTQKSQLSLGWADGTACIRKCSVHPAAEPRKNDFPE